MIPAVPAKPRIRTPLQTMPQAKDPPPADNHLSAQAEAKSVLKDKRAVVVEDEGVTQLQLRKILEAAGVKVVGVAANGKDAIKVVLDHNPDFVLMDVRMPIMDGLEASRRILENRRICIVMLTAFSEEEYQRKAQEIGTCGYVLKPVTSETLIPQIATALRQFNAQN
jgi:two-component system, response regulator PdtaR